ncbi:uncharacterized protein LOC114271381 [Camellia sinensis]|uniref:uncharacterized protein LOC114271381 n=1 Tax=Camellia sinensis TaxID=4442 RepID=UPI0010366D19|nr:uncharacterized protein LOC114271381 [Camellia sinensis]
MLSLEFAELRKQLSELYEGGLVQSSKAPYSAQVLFQKKQDGSLQMCMDYRSLNKVIIKNKYVVPFVANLFDRLSKATFFTKLDLHSGYCQVQVVKRDEEKTTCKKLSPRQARWQEFLEEYDFEWRHKLGQHNLVADALSWKEIVEYMAVISNIETQLLERIRDSTAIDSKYQRLVHQAQALSGFIKGKWLWRIITDVLSKPIQEEKEIASAFDECLDEWEGKNY